MLTANINLNAKWLIVNLNYTEAGDRHKKMMERWRIMQDVQSKIFEIAKEPVNKFSNLTFNYIREYLIYDTQIVDFGDQKR